MISPDRFRALALSLPEAAEAPHFENTAFLAGKKIFATLNEPAGRATLKLSPEDQGLYSLIDKEIIHPVPNKWGHHGWTHVILARVDEELLLEVLTVAYCTVAPKRLAALVKGNLPEA